MEKRKLVLIILDIVLLVTVIFQCVFLKRDGTKVFKIKESPDEIIIENKEDLISLKYDNNTWTIGERKYPVNLSKVNSMIDSLTFIKTIDKVSNNSTDINQREKYSLTDDKKIRVTAKKNGEVLRSIDIGKSGTTSSQNFISIDGVNGIYLATNNLGYTFDVTESDVRSNVVWNFNDSEDSKEINAVEVITYKNDRNKTKESYKIAKTGSGEDLKWTISGSYKGESVNNIEIDPVKTQSWFDSLTSLTTDRWFDEKKNIGGEKIATINISHGYDTMYVDIYSLPPVENVDESEGEDEEFEEKMAYYGKCSENPYPFSLTSYTMERLNKNPEEMAK